MTQAFTSVIISNFHFHPPLTARGISSRPHPNSIEADVRIIARERIGLERDDRTAALATILVSEIERVNPGRTIGRSMLQKLFYILCTEGHFCAPFDLFINGPYSDKVEAALGRAVETGMLTVSKEGGRSSISARGGIPRDVPPALKERAVQCVRAYGHHEEIDLAILTTALFLGHHRIGGSDELIKAVIDVNPGFRLRRVCSLLDQTDVVYRSW